MTRAVTFGEIMLRLSPPGDERLFQSPRLRTFFGGAEANVAVSLARFGLESRFVTRLPEGSLGDAALQALRAEGVDTGHVRRGGRRLGIYFAELGAGQRPMAVTYDRAGSAASEMTADSFDWSAVFAGAAWFHLTGITPALGPSPLAAARAALKAARAAGATVSFDVNYRRQLWSPAEARAALRPLMDDVDVLIANGEGLESGLGVELSSDAEGLCSDFGLTHAAITHREPLSASENDWSAVLFDAADGGLHRSPRHVVRMVDRVGAGDAFAAGLIYALLVGRPPGDAVSFAAAAGALKHTVPGDFNRVSAGEVERLATESSGR